MTIIVLSRLGVFVCFLEAFFSPFNSCFPGVFVGFTTSLVTPRRFLCSYILFLSTLLNFIFQNMYDYNIYNVIRVFKMIFV